MEFDYWRIRDLYKRNRRENVSINQCIEIFEQHPIKIISDLFPECYYLQFNSVVDFLKTRYYGQPNKKKVIAKNVKLLNLAFIVNDVNSEVGAVLIKCLLNSMFLSKNFENKYINN